MRRTLRFQIFAVMIGMAGLSCAPIAQAQAPIAPPTQPTFDPSDVYFQGWFFTREAETLMKAGRHAEALEKLRSAQKFFQTVNKFHPEWKKEMVTGRLDITTKDIARVLPLAQADQKKNEVAVAELEGGARIPVKPMPLAEPKNDPNVAIADARVQALEEEVKRLRSALASPANGNSRDAARASDLEKQRNDLSARLKETQASLDAMRAQLANAPVQSEMDRMSARIRSVEQERDAMAMALTASRGEQLNSLAKINTLSADLQVMRQQAADLERNLATERKVSNEVTKGQQQQLKDLQTALKQKDSEIIAANNRVSAVQKELAETKEAFQELRKERDDLLSERDHMAALLKLSESGRIQQLIEQNMGLAKELREAKERVARIDKDNNDTKDELTDALRDLAITKSKIISLQSEKRAQDQRLADLEMQLKASEKSIASGEGAVNDEEAVALRDIIKRQLRVQDRRKKQAALLLDAAKTSTDPESLVTEAVTMMTDEEIALTDDEQKIIEDRHVDGEIYSPYHNSKEKVGVATNDMQEQIENYTKAAVRAFSQQRVSATREVLEVILDLHPGHVPTMTKLGIVQMRLNDPLASSNILRRAVEMDETQPLPHRLLGLALYRTGDLPAAEASLRRATEIDPNDYAGLTVLGNTLFRMNRNEEAEIVYKKAVELNPQSMETLHNLAVLCHRAGRDKEAWSYYQKALENGAQPNPKLESEIPAKAKQVIETATTNAQ